MTKKKVFRMYKTKGSEKLLPIYNKLQKELNLILSNKFYKEELMKIDLKYIIPNDITVKWKIYPEKSGSDYRKKAGKEYL